MVLARSGNDQVAPVATARAAGVPVHVLRTPDPRGSGELVTALSSAPQEKVLALGAGFGTVEQLQQRLAVVRTGVQLPGGGQLAFPGRRMIALYGTPGTAALGSLGEQDLDASVARVKDLVAQYQPHSDLPVVPAFEIITTVAAGQAGADGDYSNEVDIAKIRPYVDAAKAAGIYVMLDLQPGRTDFLTQAKLYEELLAEPHVGLALDPEWRLQPGQVHRVQIGSVNVDEINQVGDWLAGLVRERNLPQKVLMLHQFRTSMIVGRERLNTAHDELALMVHADGFGTQGMKRDTWNALRQRLAERVLGLEELHRRRPADARPGPDDAGQPGHRLRLVPVTAPAVDRRVTRESVQLGGETPISGHSTVSRDVTFAGQSVPTRAQPGGGPARVDQIVVWRRRCVRRCRGGRRVLRTRGCAGGWSRPWPGGGGGRRGR